MRKTTTLAVMMCALLLTGCAAEAGTSATSAPKETPAAEISAAPATIDPTVTPTPSESVDVEAYFVEGMKKVVPELSDEEIIAAGKYACDQLAAGNPEPIALKGADEGTNKTFVISAQSVLCPAG